MIKKGPNKADCFLGAWSHFATQSVGLVISLNSSPRAFIPRPTQHSYTARAPKRWHMTSRRSKELPRTI